MKKFVRFLYVGILATPLQTVGMQMDKAEFQALLRGSRIANTDTSFGSSTINDAALAAAQDIETFTARINSSAQDSLAFGLWFIELEGNMLTTDEIARKKVTSAAQKNYCLNLWI